MITRGPLNFSIELLFNQTTTIGLRYPHSRQPDQIDKTESYFIQEFPGSWRRKANFP